MLYVPLLGICFMFCFLQHAFLILKTKFLILKSMKWKTQNLTTGVPYLPLGALWCTGHGGAQATRPLLLSPRTDLPWGVFPSQPLKAAEPSATNLWKGTGSFIPGVISGAFYKQLLFWRSKVPKPVRRAASSGCQMDPSFTIASALVASLWAECFQQRRLNFLLGCSPDSMSFVQDIFFPLFFNEAICEYRGGCNVLQPLASLLAWDYPLGRI